ncbi:acyl-CoA synthetase [Mycobacterium europaeum]|uniref:Acyl-CoA synthetase n=1 Tax=Mycobacterium europaeum TaxID=761804 RepID=A0A0U1DKA4_9MYCO|nr:class I adenylate-forming enzyme family protein [Mycobacterium europaeum]CQD18167.1 acyl-CoA synthetase [Mycobacterium europaeum]
MTAAQTASDDPAPPGLPGSVPELLSRRRTQPDGEFLVTDEERLSFAEADAQSRTLADALLASGVGKGSRVGILFPNCAQWLIAWLAAARIGALTVPLSTFAPGAELARLLRHTDTQVLLMGRSIAGRDLVDRVADALPGVADGSAAIALAAVPYLRRVHVWPDCDRRWTTPWPGGNGPVAPLSGPAEQEVGPADELVLVTTSGTTALPKSVVHTHGSLVRHAAILARHRGVTPRDRIYSPMPFFWVGGLTMVVLQALSTGATVLAQDVFDAGATLALLERERATFISCWAQASQAMADHPDFAKRDLSSVRGGTMLQALPPERRPAEPELTPNLLGMTETGGPHTMVEVPDTPLPPERRGSFGIPLPGLVEHRIVDTAGLPLPQGQEGQIQVRGQILMSGIYKQERHEVFTADGWYDTGDRGWFDEAGHLHFTGRASALIKTAGSNVSPAEVESVLDAMPGVLHSFVVALPHPVRGEVVGAAVVPANGVQLSVETVVAHARRNLSTFKIPAVVRLLAEQDLPMLATGKINRAQLAHILASPEPDRAR